MGRGCSELELRRGLCKITLPEKHLSPPQPHLPLQVQTALPQLVPLISFLTQEVVPAGLMGAARNSGRKGGDWGKEAEISRGGEEGFKKRSGARRKLGPQDPGGRSFGNPGYPGKEARPLRDGGGFQAKTQAPPI